MKNAIAFMVRNGVAANLLMLLMVFAGAVSATSIGQMVFPEFSLGQVEVRVEYPGALPSEIEDSIVQRIEEQVEGVDGISELRATASEGVGVVTIEFNRGVDVSQKLDEVKAEVDRITTFPGEAEEPQVREITNRSRVVEIALYGDVDPEALKQIADRAQDDLSAKGGISFVDTRGDQPYEISIEVENDTLRAYGLSLTDISAAVGRLSLDLPAGGIETEDEEILLRTVGRAYTGQDFADIVLVANEDGAQVRLGDVATIRDGLQDADSFIRFNGQPAVFVRVFRIGEERVLDVVEIVETYLEEELEPSLPPGVQLRVWRNDADELRNRFELLIRNGAVGLTLVIITLTLFLNLRLAFWVSLGIFVAFIGTFAVMAVLGVSINQISLFGFILAIGIVVDDAIVVGENIYARAGTREHPFTSAIEGAHRISGPVIFAVLTTVMAFLPLLFLPGTFGLFLGDIPSVVITVLLLSLVESLLVLPRHLSYVGLDERPGLLTRLMSGPQAFVKRNLERFVDGPLTRAVRFAIRHYGIIIASGIAMLMMSFGLLAGGIVPFSFGPQVEATYVTADIELAPGTAPERTETAASRVMERGLAVAHAIEDEFEIERGSIVTARYLAVGAGAGLGGGPGGAGPGISQTNEATIVLELLDPTIRPFPASLFEQRWRAAVGEIPGVRKLVFSSSLINLGDAIRIELSAPELAALERASDALVAELRSLNGVFDARSDLDQGRQEISLTLKPEARTYGLTVQDLAAQIRAAFFGAEALRVQRGQDEVRVYVRLPEAERRTIDDIFSYRVRTPAGGFVPVREVADVSYGFGPTTIDRRDGQRIITVTAAVDDAVTTGGDVNAYLIDTFLPDLVQEVPGVSFGLAGEQEEQSETGSALSRNFLLAVFAIYALLAIAFRSYTQPLVVVAAIPFGVAGAILGHLVMGITMTFISIFGIVGLSGVIINGAIVLIDFVNERRGLGDSSAQAVLGAAKARFRPILLTAITTFLGVFPLIIEQSVQAQFLVPLAVSIGFGVLFGTPILLMLVPALATVHDQWFGPPAPEEPELLEPPTPPALRE